MTCWQVRPSSHFFKGRLRAKIDYSCNYEDKTFDDQSHFSWKKPLAHGLWCHNLWIRYPTENDHDFSMFHQTWMKENCASNFKANTENLQPAPLWNDKYPHLKFDLSDDMWHTSLRDFLTFFIITRSARSSSRFIKFEFNWVSNCRVRTFIKLNFCSSISNLAEF